ncbi:AAA family ATPase [Lactiplantibacillus pentosus]|jgi:stage V sporulation protein K|uniref:AAA family ATPase n=1 Tax=Lactiplantibacillus pentosus TaxID=1589 RepID=UPI003D7A7937
MSNYLVGPDKKNFFGRRSTWDLDQAIEAASDGDVIEIEAGFNPFNSQNNQSMVITKNITIQGHMEKREGKRIYTNTIDGIVVKDGATVTLQSICIQKSTDKSNAITVRNGSTVIAENIYLVNKATTGENYPIVHVSENSNVQLSNVTVVTSKILDRKHCIYVKDSELTIRDSLIGAEVFLKHAQFISQNSQLVYKDGVVLSCNEKSTAQLSSSTLTGGKILTKKVYPCVHICDSKLVCHDCYINQPKFNMALLVSDGQLTIEGGEVDSISLDHTKATINETLIRESFAVRNSSKVAGKRIFILGRDNGKINLYVKSRSTIQVNHIIFGAVSNPNVKLERNVEFSKTALDYYQCNLADGIFLVDQNNHYMIAKKKGEVSYFGKKPALERLNDMIGIGEVKSDINEFIAIAQVNKQRKERGLNSDDMTLHSLFLGNPGTGKTTVARILGEILYDKGIIANQNFVEVSRADIVGRYIGETAIKTRGVLDSALGGVLFIDEAYTLANGGERDFGREAIDEILKFMEDHRTDIVIIFAGYTDSMEKFLAMNEGLRSRIPNHFMFEDYTPSELIEIGLGHLKAKDYTVDKAAYTALVMHNFEVSNDQSNGRWIRNLNERIIRKFAVRVAGQQGADLSKIDQQDLDAAML